MPDTSDPKSLPEQSLPVNDPGDETLQRYRYQITYSCILAVLMTEGDTDIVELFCELHEDLLLRHVDGQYTGIQIKTRSLNYPPFTIEDHVFKSTCARFVELEIKFPNLFRNFSILTNAGFDKSKTAVCIYTLIENAKAGNELLKKGTKMSKFIAEIAERCKCTAGQVVDMIKKLRVKSYSALEDIHLKLINQLKMCPVLKGLQESKLEEIADLLLAQVYKASSLNGKEQCVHHYMAGTVGDEAETIEIIKNKKFTREYVVGWLNTQKTIPVKLLLKDRVTISDIPKGYNVLEVKMDAGKIDSENIQVMKNFKFSFENHAISWMHKDLKRAEDQYNQVMLIIQNLCKEVYDEGKVAETDAGQGMLIEIRKKLKGRSTENPSLFFDCLYEHLLGAVGILTEQCIIWWSKKFEITNERPVHNIKKA